MIPSPHTIRYRNVIGLLRKLLLPTPFLWSFNNTVFENQDVGIYVGTKPRSSYSRQKK